MERNNTWLMVAARGLRPAALLLVGALLLLVGLPPRDVITCYELLLSSPGEPLPSQLLLNLGLLPPAELVTN